MTARVYPDRSSNLGHSDSAIWTISPRAPVRLSEPRRRSMLARQDMIPHSADVRGGQSQISQGLGGILTALLLPWSFNVEICGEETT